jgi:multidrug efflux pump
MRLWLDPEKMAARGVTSMDVQQALSSQNVELPGGKIEGNATELSVKTVGRLHSESYFNALIIRSVNGVNIRFSDIGNAQLGPENEQTILRLSGTPMVAAALIPQPGANYLDIAKEFYKRVDEIKKEVPEDITLGIVLDNTKFVQQSVEEVANFSCHPRAQLGQGQERVLELM